MDQPPGPASEESVARFAPSGAASGLIFGGVLVLAVLVVGVLLLIGLALFLLAVVVAVGARIFQRMARRRAKRAEAEKQAAMRRLVRAWGQQRAKPEKGDEDEEGDAE